MNTLIFAMLVACATAQWYPYPGYYGNEFYGRYGFPAYYAAPSASQYHSQDSFGQASYGYAYPGQAASNFRDAFGNQVGSYAYINPEGKEVKVSYVADANGFRVLSNNLPVAPVFDGKAPVFDGKAPEPVKDTAEVAAAKAEFFKIYKESADAAKAAPERKKRQVALFPNYDQFTADLLANSVDLNQDGQPDKAVLAAPVAYRAAPVAYHTPLAYTAPVVYSAPVATPVVAKTIVKTAVLEKNDKAKTPAATTKLDEKIVESEVYTPVAYPAYTPYGYPFAYPLIQATEEKKEDDSVKVESARKKRQVAYPFYNQFTADLLYNSVDLNRDGQPDKAVLAAPAYTYSYPTYGYSGLYY